MSRTKITTAMLFAAGLGTRLKPFTLTSPKALYPINGVPMLQRNILYLRSHGIRKVVINVHHFADQILSFLEENQNFGMEIYISDETEELLETGGGLCKARSFLEDAPFVVMNSDILTDLPLTQLMKFHQERNPLVTLAVSDRESSRKLFFTSEMRLCGWMNKKTEEQIGEVRGKQEFAFSGIHVISPAIFNKIEEKGKFSIMKPYLEMMSKEELIGFDHTGCRLLDIGKPETAKEAQELFH